MNRFVHPRLRRALGAAMLVLLGSTSPGALAAGGSSPRDEATSAEYAQAVAFIQAEQWADAIVLLKTHLQSSRKDADGHNWLAYAYRKSGQLELAFVHYKRALSLTPTHRGAHEYIGEAYLMAGKPEQAEYHLGELKRICQASCEEYQDLLAAITRFRAQATPVPRSP
jgi:Tfp pilus assembly protein PilF